MKKLNLIAPVVLAVFIFSLGACSQIDKNNAGKTSTKDSRIEMLKNRIDKDTQNYIDRNRLAYEYIQKSRVTGDLAYVLQAEGLLEQSLAINPDVSDTQIYMGLVSLSGYRFEKALEYGNKAHRINHWAARAYGIIGDAYKELGDIQKARDAYYKMKAIAPGFDSLSRISGIKAQTGDIKAQ
ncbi:MAG: hypothetical protein GWO07_14615 [Candidatus Dadabacteria bacterium]|nr:hypothetical protein [Candidatus Dadabacteria bacterium]NIS09944.1 hypothetical protein [Candidatus Dadabacteria bacterium]NIV41860.1 hypothetical protein [Candidatus Dadabacteria bacterium]NIY22919.1 hypothetical protein [Candidatus Dadabacteria bacterium]